MVRKSMRLGLGLALGAVCSVTGTGLSLAHAGALPLPFGVQRFGGNSPQPIVAVSNAGSGPAIAASSAGGSGVTTTTKYSGSAATFGGLVGQDLSTTGLQNNGVLGTTIGGGFGVRGTSGLGAEGGVGGFATDGAGIYGLSVGGPGGLFFSTSGLGAGISSQNGTGAQISAQGGTGAFISSQTGTAVAMYTASGTAAEIRSSTGIGAIIESSLGNWNPTQNLSSLGALVATGNPYGLLSETQWSGGSNDFSVPLSVESWDRNNSLTGFFEVDGRGNIYTTGKIQSATPARGGANVIAYASQSAESTMEDSGTAQLVSGNATVRLDPTYASAIDLTKPYRVFLTPDGDTRGLYVAQKTASSFVVRETQGGRSSLSFDYRVVAAATGHAADRMAPFTPMMRDRLLGLGAYRHHIAGFSPAATTAVRDTLKPGDPYARIHR